MAKLPWRDTPQGLKMALFAGLFGIRVTGDRKIATDALLRYKAPFLNVIDGRTGKWKEADKDDPYELGRGIPKDRFPWLDYSTGTIYWPKGANDPYQFLHELGHIVAGVKSPGMEDEDDGPTVAFEWMSAKWLERQEVGITHARWMEWRAETGGEEDYRLEDGYEGWRHAILRRRLFTAKGEPRQQMGWKPPRFVRKINKILDFGLYM